ncbi:MAG: SDR family oxidoreductase [Propionibacteriaceae bacterium]|nr:SDR family oxidoreductase [Propionibacteriaceae bacterium]
MGALAGRLCVVTGGTRGIGRAIVERFLAEGADLIVTARTAESGQDLLEKHPEVTFVVADASKVGDIDKIAQAVAATGRTLYSVVPNAGGGPHTHILTATEAEYDEVMDVNVKSAFFTVQKLVPFMGEGSTIVLIASIAGSNGDPDAIVYNASKAAVRSLARSMTAGLAGRRIRANAVSPGPTNTEGFDVYIGGDPAVRESLRSRLPVGHIGNPSEVAAAALFLASDESSYLAGVEIVVDGGMSQV